MICEGLHELVWMREDGMLESPEGKALGIHLGSCASCRAYSEKAARLNRLLPEVLAPEATAPELSSRVLARLTAEGSRSAPPAYSLAAALAASLLVQYGALEYFGVSLNDGLVLILGLGLLRDALFMARDFWGLLSVQAAAIPSPWLIPGLAVAALLSIYTNLWLLKPQPRRR